MAVRVTGENLAEKSTSDENILPVLRRLKQPTFFTRDRDFWNPKWCHSRYALVYLDIPEHEGQIAWYVRRFLRHAEFDTSAKRLGKVFHVRQLGVRTWAHGARRPSVTRWERIP